MVALPETYPIQRRTLVRPTLVSDSARRGEGGVETAAFEDALNGEDPDTQRAAAKCGREFLRECGSCLGGKLFLQLWRGLLC
jgi:hypothetical protein